MAGRSLYWLADSPLSQPVGGHSSVPRGHPECGDDTTLSPAQRVDGGSTCGWDDDTVVPECRWSSLPCAVVVAPIVTDELGPGRTTPPAFHFVNAASQVANSPPYWLDSGRPLGRPRIATTVCVCSPRTSARRCCSHPRLSRRFSTPRGGSSVRPPGLLRIATRTGEVERMWRW